MRIGVLGICLSLVASRAEAKSEVDRDTGDRHTRAEQTSRDTGSSYDDDDDDDDGYYHHDDCAYDCGGWYPPVEARPVSGDLELRPRLAIDHPGGGLALDVGLPYLHVSESRRAAIAWRLAIGYGRWLDHHRPEGAFYTSTLDLLRLSASLEYRHTWVTSVADLSFSLGPGFTLLRAFETFSDLSADLNETLFAGVTFGPSFRVDVHNPLLGGTTFVEGGAAIIAAHTSPYLHQYDSLIAGMDSIMISPRLGVGHVWHLTPGVALGVAYNVETIAGIEPSATFSQSVHVALRFSSYVLD